MTEPSTPAGQRPSPVMIDVNTLIGPYPFRHVPHPDPDVLVRVLDREEIDGAWVGSSAVGVLARSARRATSSCSTALEPFARPPASGADVRPDWPHWERRCRDAVDAGAPAIRAYPPQWGLGPHDSSMRELAIAAGEQGMALLLTVRFEDLRQRHPLDVGRRPERGRDPRARARGRRGASRRDRGRPRDDRGSALGAHAGRAAARLLGHLVDLGSAGGSSREAASDDRRRAVRLRHAVAAAADADAARESRPAARRLARRAAGVARDICDAERSRRRGKRRLDADPIRLPAAGQIADRSD